MSDGDDEHDRREPVGDERDADRRRPAAGLSDDGPSRSTSTSSTTEMTTQRGEHGDADDPLGDPGPADEHGQRGAEQRQHDRERNEPAHSTPPRRRSRSIAIGWSATLVVDASIARDCTVADVVLDLVVVGEQPAAVGEREQQRGDAEGDHDRGERQRLGQRDR